MRGGAKGRAEDLLDALRARPVACGLAIVVAAVAVIAGLRALGPFGGDGVFFATENAAVAGDPVAAIDQVTEPVTVFVHVSGCVASPGLYEIEEGSRVADAIEAAGGFGEGAATDAVNLARTVQDGEQIDVPSLEEEAAAGTPSPGAAGKVNINLADAAELDTITGVGPSTAEKIIAEREENGPFATIEDLKRVSGIGDKKFESMRDEITV